MNRRISDQRHPAAHHHYVCLPGQELHHGERALRTLQPELAETLREWRNAQIDILRQPAPLSAADQQRYFEHVVIPQYAQPRPAQVLFSYWLKEELIGYGGLVHIDWIDRRGEVSILLRPERSACTATHAADVRAYLPLIAAAGFRLLGLERLTSEAWDLRPHHIAAIEAFGFVREGVLRQHHVHQGRRIDAILHGLLPHEAIEMAPVDISAKPVLS
jgi:RimJ/RimL family protein N-acetyltransferase